MVRPAIAQRVKSTGTIESSAPATTRGSQPAPTRDILVIEDDPAVADVLCLALQSEGYTVEVAADGEEGLISLQQRRYRLLLLDLLLPRLDGMGVLCALREEPAWRPPVVIILSALQARADVLRALEAGADDYLTKPFDVTDLALRVGLWLRRVGPAAPVAPPGVRIHSLGRFYVEHRGRIRLSEGGRARKAATLFKYLLTHQEHSRRPGRVNPASPDRPPNDPCAQPARGPDSGGPAERTDREREVLRLVAQRLSNDEIAKRLHLAERTVRSHISHIFATLHLANRTQLALYALRTGLARPAAG